MWLFISIWTSDWTSMKMTGVTFTFTNVQAPADMRRRNTHAERQTCTGYRLKHTLTSVYECADAEVLTGSGDFSNHLRWGGRKTGSACEGGGTSQLISSPHTNIIRLISQEPPIRECWCGIRSPTVIALLPEPGRTKRRHQQNVLFPRRSQAELRGRSALCWVDFVFFSLNHRHYLVI